MKEDFNALPPVTRLIVSKCEFIDGSSFEVVTDLEPSQWDNLLNRWLRKTKKLTMQSLIEYIKWKKPFCICVSKQDYDEIVSGNPNVIPATKEDYDKENN